MARKAKAHILIVYFKHKTNTFNNQAAEKVVARIIEILIGNSKPTTTLSQGTMLD